MERYSEWNEKLILISLLNTKVVKRCRELSLLLYHRVVTTTQLKYSRITRSLLLTSFACCRGNQRRFAVVRLGVQMRTERKDYEKLTKRIITSNTSDGVFNLWSPLNSTACRIHLVVIWQNSFLRLVYVLNRVLRNYYAKF